MLPEPTFQGNDDPVIGCQGSLLVLTDANHLVFANPATKIARKYLTLRSSFDEGNGWTENKLLSTSYCGYSSMVDLEDGDMGVLYETGSSSEIEKIVYSRFGKSWLTESEVAAYEFEEESINSYANIWDTIFNNICFGLNGVVTGQIKYVAGPDSDKALEFATSDNWPFFIGGDYITIDDSTTNNVLDFDEGESFYIDTCIKTTSHGSGGSTGSGAIIAKDNGTGPQWWLRVENGYVKFLICDGAGHQPSVTSSVKVNTDSWVRITAWRDADADQLKIAVNEAIRGTAADTTTASLKNSVNVRIGNFANASRQFLGKISYIRVCAY